mgnify:CR=1 FL=1|tara:strand:+ start:672 stop:938 length:267 start_codon:yes stop_codon:yes gene_type:complete
MPFDHTSPYTEYNDLIKKAMTFQYQMHDFTLDDVRNSSSNYLRSCLKEDISPELHDMVTKELYVRDLARPITGDSDLIINDWLMKKDS